MKEVETLEGMEQQISEVEASLNHYRELSKMTPDDIEALEENIYKGQYLKEEILKQLYHIRRTAKHHGRDQQAKGTHQ